MTRRPPRSTLFPSPTLFRSPRLGVVARQTLDLHAFVFACRYSIFGHVISSNPSRLAPIGQAAGSLTCRLTNRGQSGRVGRDNMAEDRISARKYERVQVESLARNHTKSGRSEERRGGKKCRSRWSPCHL